MKKESLIKIITTVIVLGIVLVLGVWIINSIKIEATDEGIIIKGLYERTIAYNAIQRYELLDTLPLVRIRKMGIGLGFMNIGKYSISGYGNVLLLEMNLEKPYVLLSTDAETVIIGVGKKKNELIYEMINKSRIGK
jgi:hypothetical protein